MLPENSYATLAACDVLQAESLHGVSKLNVDKNVNQ